MWIISGTDSRIGFGFRLGEHADFQVLVELGPQTNTKPLGNENPSKRHVQRLNNAGIIQLLQRPNKPTPEKVSNNFFIDSLINPWVFLGYEHRWGKMVSWMATNNEYTE